MTQSGHRIIAAKHRPEDNEHMPRLGRAPMRKLLIIFCLISIASCGNVQGGETDTGDTQSHTEPGYDLPAAIAACEKRLSWESRCSFFLSTIYSQNHPDLIHDCELHLLYCRKKSLQQTIQSICSQCNECYSWESPQARLETAVKAGDLRFLGVRRGNLESVFVPCLPDGYSEPANVISVPPALGSYVENKIAAEYAAEYNLLLLKYLSEYPD